MLLASDLYTALQSVASGLLHAILAPTPDSILRSLGYDVWDEVYRADSGRQAALGAELVTLAERLGLVAHDSARLVVQNGPAMRLYYDVYSGDRYGHIAEALNRLPVQVTLHR